MPGNVTPTAEFNMFVDPEAAHRVLAAGLPLEVVPLDATRQAVLPRAGMRATLGRATGPLASRIQGFSERGFRIAHSDGEQGMALHDPLAVGLALDPSLGKWEAVRLAIGPDGETHAHERPAELPRREERGERPVHSTLPGSPVSAGAARDASS